MSKVRLQHYGKDVSVIIDADASKVRNHNPLRFRISHGVTVNTGINTWFMSRQQVTEVQLEVLTEILEAKQPGSEKVVDNAEKRVSSGQRALVATIQQVGHLTHPDIMMLIDMRQNSNQYVNRSSAFANMFNALARKVMDLSFYATLNDPNPKQQREDFIRSTGAVTRGMDQFIYYRPNASAANPYVNFSVIPAGQNYENVRFPTHFDPRTQTKEKIPKTRFGEIYAYYVNELFDCYRRYLRMLGVAEILPGNTDEVSADALAQPPGGPGEGGAEAEALIESLHSHEESELQADQEALDAANEAERLEQDRQYEEAARKEAKRERKLKERSKTVKLAVKSALEEFKAAHEAKKTTSKLVRTGPEPVGEHHVQTSLDSATSLKVDKPPEAVPDISSSSYESPMDTLMRKIKKRLDRSVEKEVYRIVLDVSKRKGSPSYDALVDEALKRKLVKEETYKGKKRLVRFSR